MIAVRRSADRGYADHGWLKTYHTFSFADYHDPDFVHFSVLRVLNQDRVAPGRGFGTHGHDNMEIVSYVLDGVLEHRDSMGNGSQMRPGDVQLMSAGVGVTHSEFNASETQELHFLQMWIFPARRGTAPQYQQKNFSEDERMNQWRLVVSPDGRDGSLTIGQDAHLRTGIILPGASIEHALPPGRCAWLHVARGSVRVNGEQMATGDGAAIVDESTFSVEARERTEAVLWELPNV